MDLTKNQDIKKFAFQLLRGYWGDGANLIEKLPVNQGRTYTVALPVKLSAIMLPSWARHCGVEGQILVPREVVSSGDLWSDIDWWYVIHWYTNCLAEREYENLNGPIHSYSFKLSGWDERMWQYAWVNRIAMFLYCWANHIAKGTPNETQPKPVTSVLVTFDLDAIRKTKAIRFKQTAFQIFNALKTLKKLKIAEFKNKILKAIAFFFRNESYMNLNKLNQGAISPLIRRKIINIYGGDLGYQRPLKELLIDPSYDIKDTQLVNALLELEQQNYEFGLHQSFEAWQDSDLMYKQRVKVSQTLNRPIETCRQHWLRFSFHETWLAQHKAGFKEDTTLGFNDRLGFRNGLALAFDVKQIDQRFKSSFIALPMILMDSHLYDYTELNEVQRKETIIKLVNEVIFVGGTVSVIWHPHTLGKDYNWENGYKTLLQVLRERA